jgi:formyl-CoA transferase
MDMVRATADTEPARSVPGMGDHPSGTGLYAAIVTALYRREKTGKGGIAQSSLLQNGLWANACFVQSRLFGEHVPVRAPRSQAPNPLANHYRCRDGRWFLMALFNEQRQLPGFLAAIGATDLAGDRRFATPAARKENARAMVAVLDEVFAQKDLPEWREILLGAGVTFGAMHTVDEASDDAQFQQVGALVPFADGKGLTIASPFHLDGEMKVAPRRAPSVGQHTEEVLREAGYSAGEIERLRAQGVLG